jgi:hypothetical protein
MLISSQNDEFSSCTGPVIRNKEDVSTVKII